MGSVGMYNHDPLACSGPDTTIRRPKLAICEATP